MSDADLLSTDRGVQELRKAAFRDLTSKLHQYYAREAANGIAYRDANLPYFSAMPIEKQSELLKSLAIQLDLLHELDQAGRSILREGRFLVFNLLQRMGLTPAPEVAERLEDIDYVAIYNRSQQMLFLSPNHCLWSAHTLEDLHCRPWFDNFRRDETVERILMHRAMEVVLSEHPHTIINTDIQPHLVSEVGSAEPRWVMCYSKFYAPVFRDGRPVGFIAANQDRLRADRSRKLLFR